MAKKPYHKNHNFLTILLVVLVVIIGIICAKFVWAKVKWNHYALQMQTRPLKYAALDSAEDAGMIAATIMTVPANNPLFKQTKALETYIQTLSKQTGRDIVIVNKDRTVLADTLAENVGQVYAYDNGDEVRKSIADGQVHTFVEKSNDYTAGISQTVIPLKAENGDIIGAIVLSNSQVFK